MSTPEAVIRALCIGRPRTVSIDERKVRTAIAKQAVTGPLAVGELGLEGDTQANRRVHGGPDKALCVYPKEHYGFWEQWLGRPLPPGSFGENLQVEGLLESEVAIGDLLQVGAVRLQVRAPRTPCFKLAHHLQRPSIIEEIFSTGFCGFYLSVLMPGTLQAGQSIEWIRPEPEAATVQAVLFSKRKSQNDASAAPGPG